MPTVHEIIFKLIVTAIVGLLVAIGKFLWNWLRHPDLRDRLRAGNMRLDQWLDRCGLDFYLRVGCWVDSSWQLSNRQLLIKAGRSLSFSMILLFYALGLCAFLLGIVEKGYSVQQAFLVFGVLAASGHFMRWYLNKLIVS